MNKTSANVAFKAVDNVDKYPQKRKKTIRRYKSSTKNVDKNMVLFPQKMISYLINVTRAHGKYHVPVGCI